MEFHLQSDGDRSVISEKVENGFRVDSTVEAEDWLHAKREFGFEMTDLQETLLPLSDQARLQVVETERWEGVENMTVKRLPIAAIGRPRNR